jgi:hypothetical protein
MGFLKKMFGGGSPAAPDGVKLAPSADKADYAQVALLAEFDPPRALHAPAERTRWSRALPHPYDESVKLLEKYGWLASAPGAAFVVTSVGAPAVQSYRARQESEKAAALLAARKALQERDTGEALAVRRAYEARQPLGRAGWTGPEPQLSHSALTRRILFLQHWLLDGLSPDTTIWLKLYAAEQHLWGASWQLTPADVPAAVQQELATSQMDGVEAAYWKAHQLALFVDNQETWQRCKGGDHVRRIEIVGPDDEYTCTVCRAFLGKEFLVARVPELPPRECTSPRGCRCRYEPVLETPAAP